VNHASSDRPPGATPTAGASVTASHPAGPGQEDHRKVERLREAVYGTIIMLSVLAMLSEYERDAAVAAIIVAGSLWVLFFAHLYAGSIAERIELGRLPSWAGIRRLASASWPLVAVTTWPVLLLGIAALGLIDTADAFALAIGLSVAALGVWGWSAGRMGHASLRHRLWSTALDVAVGLGIVALKVAFH
jgi:hypothetical protein